VSPTSIKTSILPPTVENLDLIATWLREGNVAAIPTETVYGLAANALDIAAVRQIFAIKNRPFYDPLIVHVPDAETLFQWTEIDEELRKTVHSLLEAFSPGPLTYVLPKKSWVPDIVTSGHATVALRIPRHPVFQEILCRSGCAIAAPSANPFGYISPTSASHVFQSLGGKLRYILDGGDCEIGLESTIIDISHEHIRILRPGKITGEAIQAVWPKKIFLENYSSKNQDNFRPPLTPGMLQRHYSPRTPLYLFSQKSELPLAMERNVARVLLSQEGHQGFRENDFFLSRDGNLALVAKRLFALLRELDDSHAYKKIYCQCPPLDGLGAAIADRLRRAAASSDGG
jgi:L-threonylcarbamoyladenylate synthase